MSYNWIKCFKRKKTTAFSIKNMESKRDEPGPLKITK